MCCSDIVAYVNLAETNVPHKKRSESLYKRVMVLFKTYWIQAQDF